MAQAAAFARLMGYDGGMPVATIKVPPSTRISPITSIAPHLTCIRTETAEQLPDCQLRVEKIGERVSWHTGTTRAIFEVSDLLGIKTEDAPFMGQTFLALVATFRDASGPMSYRVLVGPQSDANWFNATADQLRSLIWQ
jgi:hypothetical protein